MNAHTFKWVTDKEASAAENGSKHEECEICGYKKAAVEIPATGVSRPEESNSSRPGITTDIGTNIPGTTTGTNTSAPQTGDSSHPLVQWLALLTLTSAGLTGVGLYSKKRKAS